MIEEYRRPAANRLAFLDVKYPPWLSAASLAGAFAVWEAIARAGFVSELFLPAPSSVLREGADMLQSGEIFINLAASLSRILMGYAIGCVFGLAAGLVTGMSKLADITGTPVIYALYPIPKIALLPLIILWLGIGETSKITVIALGVFFPVAINTWAGVKNVDPLFIKVAASFHATRFNLMRKVILPGALPTIFAGLKLSAGTSLLMLVAAEMIAAQEGIGAMILHYGDLMLTTKLMVGVIILSLLGLVFTNFLQLLEKKIVPWK
jgi:NitT/TauT family transport system permease protein